jgi:hypothetical protein
MSDSNPTLLPRKLLIFAIIVPLAAFLGYLLSDPDFGSFILIGGLVSLLLSPVFMRWHHVILVASWNVAMTAFFLPANPPVWMLLALISLAVSILHVILDKHKRLNGVASVTWSLVALGLVVLLTMKVSGGFALRSMGGNVYGGRKYFYVLFAIVAYFALSLQTIPAKYAHAQTGAFFLGGVTPALSSFIYFLGPSMWFLYELFTPDWAVGQAMEDLDPGYAEKIGRMAGLAPAGMAIFFFMLSRFGLRGVLEWSRPWRLVILVGSVALSLLGGFRSLLVLTVLITALQFYLEGLHRTRLLPVVLLTGTILLALAFPYANKMPKPIQRCLSILPVDIDPAVRMDAMNSTEWRLRMWEILLPEVPHYLFIGKGCAVNSADYFLAVESIRRGLSHDYEFSIVSGDYHNGPLSVLIPFGLPGALAFVCFLVAGTRVLVINYRYGDPQLKTINTLLFSTMIAKIFFFLVIFGGIHSDLFGMVGLVGLSISLNRGLAKAPQPVEAPSPPPIVTTPARLRRPSRT